MYRITCVLQGVVPVMFNKPLPETLEDIDTGKTGGRPTVEQKKADAKRKVHVSPDGYLGIPAWNIQKCMEGGAGMANLKEKRRGLASYLKATVFVKGFPVFEPKRKEPDLIDERPGRIPPGPKGMMAILRRPMMKEGWILPIEIDVVDDNRQPDQIRAALEAGGIYAGIGPFRPQYGRFIVKDFKVIK